MRRTIVLVCCSFALTLLHAAAHAQAPPRQAVVETSAGTFILDLMAEAAPATVALFMKTVESGGYNGTAFHRAVRNGMVQGGDPLSTDPSKKAQYGQGGLNLLKAEPRAPKMFSGAVASVLVPGKPELAMANNTKNAANTGILLTTPP